MRLTNNIDNLDFFCKKAVIQDSEIAKALFGAFAIGALTRTRILQILCSVWIFLFVNSRNISNRFSIRTTAFIPLSLHKTLCLVGALAPLRYASALTRNRTWIPNLGGLCSIHWTTGSSKLCLVLPASPKSPEGRRRRKLQALFLFSFCRLSHLPCQLKHCFQNIGQGYAFYHNSYTVWFF